MINPLAEEYGYRRLRSWWGANVRITPTKAMQEVALTLRRSIIKPS
jgi:hypothetical protein